MWQFHLLHLFTKSHGDLIIILRGSGVVREALKDWLRPANMTAYRNQIPVHLPLVFLMLVFDTFIKG